MLSIINTTSAKKNEIWPKFNFSLNLATLLPHLPQTPKAFEELVFYLVLPKKTVAAGQPSQGPGEGGGRGKPRRHRSMRTTSRQPLARDHRV